MTWEDKIYFDVRRAVKKWFQCLLSHLNGKRPGCLRAGKSHPLNIRSQGAGRSSVFSREPGLTPSSGHVLDLALTGRLWGRCAPVRMEVIEQFWSVTCFDLKTICFQTSCLSNKCQILRAPESTNLLVHLFIYSSTTNLLMDLINHLCLLLIIWYGSGKYCAATHNEFGPWVNIFKGCHNKVPQVGGSDNWDLFYHKSEGHKSEIRMSAGLMISKASLFGL